MPSFQQIAATNDASLYALEPGTDVTWANGWAGYLLLGSAGGISTLTPQQAWQEYWGNPILGRNGGIYLFASTAPTDPPAFLSRLATYVAGLNQGAPAYRYFVWVANPNEPGLITAQAMNFAFDNVSGKVSVKQACSLKFKNIWFQIRAGVSVSLSDHLAFNLQSPGSLNLQFVNTIGRVSNFGQIVGAVSLELVTATPGRLTTRMRLSAENPTYDNDLKQMRTGVEYFYTNDAGEVIGNLSPILRNTMTPDLFMSVMMDPLHPLDATRTRFTFVPDENGNPPPRFSSFFVTDGGHAVYLSPQSHDAGFVLQAERYPLSLTDGATQTSTYYFTPIGRFTLSLDPVPPNPLGTPQANLLCGLSGLETITIAGAGPNYAGDVLQFHPDQPAFAPVFPLPAVDLRKPGSPRASAQLLTSDYTTAWATIIRNTQPPDPLPANAYYSQPDGSPLYTTGVQTVSDAPVILSFHPTLLGELGTDAITDSFPLVPYSGADPKADSGVIAAFESQLISPTRKQQILAIKSKRPPLAASGATIRVTTSQGLLATVPASGAGPWQSLRLATNQDGDTRYSLEFQSLDPRLQDALQANQQFLVMSQLPKDSTMNFANQIGIQGWPFQIDVGKGSVPGDYRNVLIFKFMPGKLSDHVTHPSNWTGGEDFNAVDGQGLAYLSQWLQDYIKQARQLAELEKTTSGKSYFQNFLDIVDCETWQGILALRTDVTVNSFPEALRGLLGGVDLTQFCAHHLGIEVNFVQPGPSGLDFTGNSSLFGLIHYLDAAYLTQLSLGADPDHPVASAPGDYDFKVLTLKVLFGNTEVKTFDSKLQFTANSWFGDSVDQIVKADGSTVKLPSNSILLDGSLQKHDGQDVFTFSSKTDRLFRLKSNVLGVVELVQAQFATLSDAEDANGGLVRSRFSFACYLNFMPPAAGDSILPFDALSYGSDWLHGIPGSGQGLYASQVDIDMSFPQATPGVRTFTFNPTALSFDIPQSRTRRDSLVPGFPLKVTSLVSGSASQGPAQMGYLPVSVSDASLTGLKGDWTGLVFKLDLGTLGSLAGSAGLHAQMMMAWSVGSGSTVGTYDVAIFVQLPGTGSDAKLLSLQGILKLAIQDIQLVRGETQDQRPAYMLKLTQIALKFLGISFPPQGNTVFFLFGNPQAGSPQDTLGWYAAYVKTPSPQRLAQAGTEEA